MKITDIAKTISAVAGRGGLVVRKYSPEILMAMGIGGGVVSTVMACKATLKVEAVLDTHKEKIGKIDECWEKVKEGDIALDEYSENDRKKDLTVVYTQTAVNFIKLYGPAITLGVASVVCILSGHKIMHKRNLAIVAAYKAVEEGFAAYRKRVVDEYGEQKDFMFKNGLVEEQVMEEQTSEDGKVKKVKVNKLAVPDGTTPSVYAKFFDEGNKQWTKDAQYNLLFLKGQQDYFNLLLQQRHHVFLNEVYDALGFDRTKAGAIVGWAIQKGHEGDNCIDFGIFDGDRQKVRDFVNGYERSILLDFNVDGVIYDLI